MDFNMMGFRTYAKKMTLVLSTEDEMNLGNVRGTPHTWKCPNRHYVHEGWESATSALGISQGGASRK